MRSRKLWPGSAVIRTTISSDNTLVPPITPERSVSASRSTGADSPVTAASLMVARPRTISPSAGTNSPALTITRSPGCSSAAGTLSSVAPTSAVARRRAIRSWRARRSEAAWPRPRASATASAKLPNSTVTNKIAVTVRPKPSGAPPLTVSTSASKVPAMTMAITGLCSRCIGASLRTDSSSARRRPAASSRAGRREAIGETEGFMDIRLPAASG
ncbi:hypothetical protein D3C71_1067010 [compost metagenome]